jgi:hypothetical protein
MYNAKYNNNSNVTMEHFCDNKNDPDLNRKDPDKVNCHDMAIEPKSHNNWDKEPRPWIIDQKTKVPNQ